MLAAAANWCRVRPWPKSSESTDAADAPATPSLPQNIEAEAALLGALMIDNRLVEDVQLQAQARTISSSRCTAASTTAILRMTDKNMVANPVTLKPMFEADEAMKEVGGPAYLAQLTGSGAAVIGARDFAQQIYDLALAPRAGRRSAATWSKARSTRRRTSRRSPQIERAEGELYRVAEQGGSEGKVKSFGEATKLAIEQAERALNTGGHLSAA